MSVGDDISSARVQRGLSVDDVAASTRIRATLIRAIEADDYALCGGAVYARGHIRSIARVVGIPAAPLIEAFDREHEVEPAPATVAAQPTDPDVVARSERRQPNWAAAMVVALVVICAVAAVGLFTGGSSPSHVAAVKAGATPVHASHSASPRPVSSAPAPGSLAQIPADRASMLVRAGKGQTWLSVSSKSGGVLYQGLLRAGHQKTFTDKRGLSFVIGNAPAVDLVVNGHDIGSPHSSGNVSRGRVTPGADTVQQA